MTQYPLFSYLLHRKLKHNVNHRCRIHCHASAQSRLELDFVGGADCGFIETVTQTAHYFFDLQFAVRSEGNLQQDFSLQLQLARFICVNGIRFVHDLHWSRGRTVVNRVGLVGSCYFTRCESCRLQSTSVGAAVALSWLRDAASKPGAGDRTLNSFCPAGPVA